MFQWPGSKFFHLLLWLIFSLLCNFTASSQTGHLEEIKESKQLNSNYIDEIFQDSYGLIWIGSEFGLNYYDGYHVYKKEIPLPHYSKSLPPVIHKIVEDKKFNLWICTNYGLLSYNLNTEKFLWHNLNEPSDIYTSDLVFDCYIDLAGRLFVIADAAYFSYNEQSESFDKHKLPVIEGKTFKKIIVDQFGKIWFSDGKNMVSWNPESREMKKYLSNEKDSCSPGPYIITKLFIDSKQNLWMGLSSGLNKYNPETDCFERHNIVGGILDLEEGLDGSFWLATWEDGLCKYNSKTNSLVKEVNKIGGGYSKSIRSIFVDKDNTIWLGTSGNGMQLYKEDYWKFKHIRQQNEKGKGLNSGPVRVFEETEGYIWVGTENGGLNKFDKSTGEFDYLLNVGKDSAKKANLMVLAICQDDDQQLWVGTIAGLHKINKEGNGYGFHFLDCFQDQTFPQIWNITKGNDGILWLGTSNGLVKFNPRTNKSELFQQSTSEPNSLSNNKIPAICVQSEEIIWIGTKNGLNRFYLSKGRFERFYHDHLDGETIPGNAINDIYYSAKGELWISTNNGISKYNPDKNNFITYSSDNWPSKIILGVLEDKKGNLWISSHNGMINMKPKGEIIKTYNVDDGLQNNQFLPGAFFKSRNGEMFFGGVNGFNSFVPEEIKINANLPDVLLSTLAINNQEIKVGDPKSPLQKALKCTTDLELKYSQNTFNLGFMALEYIDTEKVEYAYILEGFDKTWVFSDNRQTAFYTNVPYGDYVFKVKASNSDGVWNEKGASLNISIQPPFWASWWAKIIYVLIPIFLLYLFRKYSIVAVEAKNQMRIDQLEKEKVKEVYDMKMRFFMNISHEFRTPLTLIIDPLENVLSQLKKEAKVRETLKLSHKNALRMLRLVNQLLEFRKIETGNTRLRVSKNDVVDFVKDLSASFQAKAEMEEIQLEVKSEENQISLWFDKEKLEKITLNLLSNAFKYTSKGGQITIHITKTKEKYAVDQKRLFHLGTKEKIVEKDYVKIEVQDTGKGIPLEQQEKIFDRFFQASTTEDRVEKGSGIGLSLVKSLIDMHKGKISVESKLNQGSCFTVLLPTGKKHFEKDDFIKHEKLIEEFSGREELVPEESPDITISQNGNKENTQGQELILFVDDNIEITNYVKQHFSKKWKVITACNGQEGFEMALKHIPDLIITDVMMPITNGIELTHQIKSNEIIRHIPVIILSARTADESKKSGFTEGATDYILKPFSIKLLELKVKNLLADRKILQEKYKKSLALPTVEISYNSLDEDFMKRLKELVEENIAEANFEVDFIVKELGMSRAQLYRKVNSLTGQSVKEFVRNVRLRTAANLLEKGELRVNEVMGMAGFSNRAYFIKYFKEMFGTNPSQYGKKQSKL